jgi:hypothetical protein
VRQSPVRIGYNVETLITKTNNEWPSSLPPRIPSINENKQQRVQQTTRSKLHPMTEVDDHSCPIDGCFWRTNCDPTKSNPRGLVNRHLKLEGDPNPDRRPSGLPAVPHPAFGTDEYNRLLCQRNSYQNPKDNDEAAERRRETRRRSAMKVNERNTFERHTKITIAWAALKYIVMFYDHR